MGDRAKCETLKTLLEWTAQLAAQREQMGVIREFATVNPTEYDTVVYGRPQLFVDWLVERANQGGKSWSFAVILTPRGDIDMPRYRQELRTFICSKSGPYYNNPYTVFEEGYTHIAFELGHLIYPRGVRKGSVYPEKFEKDICSLIAVPTYFHDHINGVLYVASNVDGHSFSHADELLLSIMARITGQIIGNSRSSESNSFEFENAITRPRVVNPIFYAFKTEVDLDDQLDSMITAVVKRQAPITSCGLIAVDINKSKTLLQDDDNPSKLRTQEEVDRFFRDIGSTLVTTINRPIFQTKLDRFVLWYENGTEDEMLRDVSLITKRFASYVYDVAHVRPNGAIMDIKIRLGAVIANAEYLRSHDKSGTVIDVLYNDLATALEKSKKHMYQGTQNSVGSVCHFICNPDDGKLEKTERLIVDGKVSEATSSS